MLAVVGVRDSPIVSKSHIIVDSAFRTQRSCSDWQIEWNEIEKAFSGEDALKCNSCTLVIERRSWSPDLAQDG